MQNPQHNYSQWPIPRANFGSQKWRFSCCQSYKQSKIQCHYPLVLVTTITFSKPMQLHSHLHSANKFRFRHGLKQLRNPWADGPEYVTQCPIQPGATYTYRFTIQDQEGTLWWHAHSKWLRATVYGALIIYPRLGTPYPFSMPKKEFPLLLGNIPKTVFQASLFLF